MARTHVKRITWPVGEPPPDNEYRRCTKCERNLLLMAFPVRRYVPRGTFTPVHCADSICRRCISQKRHPNKKPPAPKPPPAPPKPKRAPDSDMLNAEPLLRWLEEHDPVRLTHYLDDNDHRRLRDAARSGHIEFKVADRILTRLGYVHMMRGLYG